MRIRDMETLRNIGENEIIRKKVREKLDSMDEKALLDLYFATEEEQRTWLETISI